MSGEQLDNVSAPNPKPVYGGPMEDMAMEQRLNNMLRRIEEVERRLLHLEEQSTRPHQ